MNGHNIFSGAYVDRQGHRRKETDWVAEQASRQDACFIPVWQNKCMIGGDPPALSLFGVGDITPGAEPVFLGLYRGQPAFTCDLDCPLDGHGQHGEYHDLRFLGTQVPEDDANIAAHAIALVQWHRRQRFCGICGSDTRPVAGGNNRVCDNSSCAEQVFPRVDPAIIVLVENGESCLLGRQSTWPEDRYSTIAGFVEPGESLEDAVRREVFEETNVVTGDVQYHSSQPWPFPSSLMLGFTARAESTDIHLNDGELEDARWFTRDACRSGFPKLPYRLSIARRLVEDWLNKNR